MNKNKYDDEICDILDKSNDYTNLAQQYSTLFEKLMSNTPDTQREVLREIDTLTMNLELVIFKIAYCKGAYDAQHIKK